MTEIAFYHLEQSPGGPALPRLLEKVLANGLTAGVKAGSPEQLAALNASLWTYANDSFLPHGSVKDGFDEAQSQGQPIWLTVGDDNPNQATVLVLADGVPSEMVADYQRCLEMFDGNDQIALDSARSHWQAYKSMGYDLTYWRQGESGGWEKQAL